MKIERKFKAIKIGLMRSKPFGLLRGVAMHGKSYLTTDIPTAMTDGRDCWYNPDFIFGFANGDKAAAFVIVHEWMHKAGMHFTTYQTLRLMNAIVANMAMDEWNNNRIILADPKGEYVQMPKDADGNICGLCDPKYADWTVKRIFYDKLEQLKEREGGEEGEGKGEGEGEGTGDGDSPSFDEHDWDGADELTKEEKQELKRDIVEAIRSNLHANSRPGQGGLRDALGLEELVAPQVNWPMQLRQFLNSTCRKKEHSSWRRPNRRYLYQDIIMPTLEGHSIKCLVECRDASGSMFYQDRLKKVTSEMVGISKMLNIDEIHVIDWDGTAEHRGVFTSDELQNAPPIKEVIGGGGTNPRCVSDYLKDNNIKPDAVVMLTDGEINDWGNWTVPLLWVICNTSKITAPMGKTINID